MWYAEASVHPLLNRRMKDRHKANSSDREHPWTLVIGCNIVKKQNELKKNKLLFGTVKSSFPSYQLSYPLSINSDSLSRGLV